VNSQISITLPYVAVLFSAIEIFITLFEDLIILLIPFLICAVKSSDQKFEFWLPFPPTLLAIFWISKRSILSSEEQFNHSNLFLQLNRIEQLCTKIIEKN